MSGISLADAQAILDLNVQAQMADPAGTIGSYTLAGRTTTYKSAADLIDYIDYYSGIVARLQRKAAGGGRIGFSVASFNSR